MCMQDLIISRGTTVRPVLLTTTATILGQAFRIIPPNPNRVWVTVHSVADNSPLSLRYQVSAEVVAYLPPVDGGGLETKFATATVSLGLFNSSLLVLDPGGDVWMVEAVMDTPLATAVQKGYEELVGR